METDVVESCHGGTLFVEVSSLPFNHRLGLLVNPVFEVATPLLERVNDEEGAQWQWSV